MRMIQFRGKFTADKTWKVGWLESDFFGETPGIAQGKKLYPVDPETVCQFIGVKDRQGHSIFEGDIIEFYVKDSSGYIDKKRKYKGIVEFDFYYCCYLVNGIKCGTFKFGYQVSWQHCKVIGNRFDNPELCERKHE